MEAANENSIFATKIPKGLFEYFDEGGQLRASCPRYNHDGTFAVSPDGDTTVWVKMPSIAYPTNASNYCVNEASRLCQLSLSFQVYLGIHSTGPVHYTFVCAHPMSTKDIESGMSGAAKLSVRSRPGSPSPEPVGGVDTARMSAFTQMPPLVDELRSRLATPQPLPLSPRGDGGTDSKTLTIHDAMSFTIKTPCYAPASVPSCYDDYPFFANVTFKKFGQNWLPYEAKVVIPRAIAMQVAFAIVKQDNLFRRDK